MAIEDLLSKVREIRLQMKAEHPDHGGSGDGAMFAAFSDQLKKLRKQIDEMKSGAK